MEGGRRLDDIGEGFRHTKRKLAPHTEAGGADPLRVRRAVGLGEIEHGFRIRDDTRHRNRVDEIEHPLHVVRIAELDRGDGRAAVIEIGRHYIIAGPRQPPHHVEKCRPNPRCVHQIEDHREWPSGIGMDDGGRHRAVGGFDLDGLLGHGWLPLSSKCVGPLYTNTSGHHPMARPGSHIASRIREAHGNFSWIFNFFVIECARLNQLLARARDHGPFVQDLHSTLHRLSHGRRASRRARRIQVPANG